MRTPTDAKRWTNLAASLLIILAGGTVYAFGATPATAEIAFNTAYVYGRDGALLGVHNKNILYETRRRTSQPGCGRSAWFWASRWSSCGIFWWHV